MNWVPLLFIDDVCHRLRKPEFTQVSQLSDSWSKVGSKHGKTRREFRFRCELNGNQEVNYNLQETTSNSKVTVADLNLEFDRITALACDSASPILFFSFPNDHRVSLREFERNVLPTIALLVANCCWPHLPPQRSAQNRIFFNAFKNCPGFREINVQEQGKESRDFLARQVDLGNVQRLTLSGTGNWPETETLKKFVNSAMFHELYYRRLLLDDYELFELFLERALANELKPGARVSAPGTNFDKSRLLVLHPEFRDDSEDDVWLIPESNLRIALRQRATGLLNDSGQITMEVE